MTMSTDPLTAWLHQFQADHGAATEDSQRDDDRDTMAWHRVQDESLSRFAEALARSDDWRECVAAQVRTATVEAAGLAERLAKMSLPEEDWLGQLSRFWPGDTSDDELPFARDLFGGFPIWPALGLSSPDQADWEDARQAIPALRRASEQYSEQLLAMMSDALERWKAQLLADDKPCIEPEQLRQRWLNALEDAWQAMLKDPEHTRRLRELTMAVDRLRASAVRLSDNMLRPLGLPSRTDLLGTQQRLLEVRRRMRAMPPPGELEALRRDMDALRQEVAELRRGEPFNGKGGSEQ